MRTIKVNKQAQMTAIINKCVEAALKCGINSLQFRTCLMAAQNAYSRNQVDICNFSCKLGFALEQEGISVSEFIVD